MPDKVTNEFVGDLILNSSFFFSWRKKKLLPPSLGRAGRRRRKGGREGRRNNRKLRLMWHLRLHQERRTYRYNCVYYAGTKLDQDVLVLIVTVFVCVCKKEKKISHNAKFCCTCALTLDLPVQVGQ